MRAPLAHRDLGKVKRAHALNASHIHAVLMRRRAPLVKGIDAAMPAKEMLGLPGVELVERQRILPLQYLDSAQLG